MLLRPRNLEFWLNVAAAALLVVMSPRRRANKRGPASKTQNERPFGEPQSSEETSDVELRRAPRPRPSCHASSADPLARMVRHTLAHLSRDAVGSSVVDCWGCLFLRIAGDL